MSISILDPTVPTPLRATPLKSFVFSGPSSTPDYHNSSTYTNKRRYVVGKTK